MTPQPKRTETAPSSIRHDDIASVYRSVLENAPGGSATDPHNPTRDLAVLSRPLPHPTNKTRSAFDVPGPEAPPPLESQSGPAFSTPPNLSPNENPPEEPAPAREGHSQRGGFLTGAGWGGRPRPSPATRGSAPPRCTSRRSSRKESIPPQP